MVPGATELRYLRGLPEDRVDGTASVAQLEQAKRQLPPPERDGTERASPSSHQGSRVPEGAGAAGALGHLGSRGQQWHCPGQNQSANETKQAHRKTHGCSAQDREAAEAGEVQT